MQYEADVGYQCRLNISMQHWADVDDQCRLNIGMQRWADLIIWILCRRRRDITTSIGPTLARHRSN